MTARTAPTAIPAFAPTESPLSPVVGAALAVGEEVAVGVLDDKAVWLNELATEDEEVGVAVAVAVVPITVTRRANVVAIVSPAREVMFK